MNRENLIQQYFAKTLSEEDRVTVESLLKSDPQFKSEFQEYEDLARAFEISEGKSLKNRFQEVEKNLSQTTRFAFLKSKVLYAAIACAVVIGFYYKFYRVETGNSLFSSNFTFLPNTYQPIVRGVSSNDTTEAFSAYESGDYETAEKEFEQIILMNEDPNIQFYYGLTLLNQSKFELALDQFSELENVNHHYKSEALWFTALIYLRKEDFKKTKQYLEKLKVLKSKFKSEEIKLLLQELEDIE